MHPSSYSPFRPAASAPAPGQPLSRRPLLRSTTQKGLRPTPGSSSHSPPSTGTVSWVACRSRLSMSASQSPQSASTASMVTPSARSDASRSAVLPFAKTPGRQLGGPSVPARASAAATALVSPAPRVPLWAPPDRPLHLSCPCLHSVAAGCQADGRLATRRSPGKARRPSANPAGRTGSIWATLAIISTGG